MPININKINEIKDKLYEYNFEDKLYEYNFESQNFSKINKNLEIGTLIFYKSKNEYHLFGISDKDTILPVFIFYNNFKNKINLFDKYKSPNIFGPSPPKYKLAEILSSNYDDKIPTLSSKYDDNIGIGLRNEGNTCYANASMQMFLHCKKLTENISNLKKTSSMFIEYYYKLIKYFLSGKTNYNIYHLLKIMSLTNPIFLDGSQHDPLEFIYNFLTILNQELIKDKNYFLNLKPPKNKFENYKYNYFKKNNTIITLFVGFFKIITVFNNKKIESYSPFKSLDLPLIEENGEKIYNIYNSIKYLTKNKGNFTFKLEELPYYLIINLKRVKNEKHLNQNFDYPKEINFKNFMPQEYKKSTNYRLIGVIKHFGDENGGHKIAVCKHLNLNSWKVYNDSSVSPADEDDVFGGEANILLYELY